MTNVVVVQIHFNRLEYSKICLNSYFENVEVGHKLILWDNGSKDGTTEFLQSLETNKELIDSLPFKVEFRYSGENVRWADVINKLWGENPDADYLGYCPNDMYIGGDWIKAQLSFLDHDVRNYGASQVYHEKRLNIAVLSDPISNRERQQPQEPYTYDYTGIVVKDKFGDVPTDCMPSLLRNELYKKYGPMVEGGGMGAMIFYHGMLQQKGYTRGWCPTKNSTLAMYHPLLSFENTPKYKLYREWLHKFKRGQLGDTTPPPDMYKGLSL